MRLKIFGFQLIFAKFYATLTTRFRFCLLVTKGGSCNIYAYLIYLFSFFSASSQRKFAFVHGREMLPDSTFQDSPLGQWTYFLVWFYESPDIPKANEDFFRKCSSYFRIRTSQGEWIPSVLSRNTWNLAPTEEIGVFQGGYVAFNGRRKVWMRTNGSRSTIAVKLPRFIGCLLVIDCSRRNLFIMGRSADGILVWLRLKTSWSVRLCLFSYDS